MKYEINPAGDGSNYLNVSLTLENCPSGETKVQLPAWRPGRYELQNFAQYIRKVKAFKEKDIPLEIAKISKDEWLLVNPTVGTLTIRYQFYADVVNAGGSCIQQDFLYINPVNCCMYHPDRMSEPCEMTVHFEPNNDIAGGMRYTREEDLTVFSANDYHELVDSPFFIASKLQHIDYEIDSVHFHLWIKGPWELPTELLRKDFIKFTRAQIEVFGEFPGDSFHFMLLISQEAAYHGVEHSRSTMMTLGPDTEKFEAWYNDLLGLSSHELFHAWNIKRIRPVELLPYDYSREMYFSTCFVAEGLTTFYGDWMLYRSGVFDKATYLNELETTLRRHFETADKADLSLLESSWDLWLDGYKKGAPDRKVSVYHKGAAAALILNHLIETSTSGKKNLDDLMRLLWRRYGKPYIGYTYEGYKSAAQEIAGTDLTAYFENIISGNASILTEINEALKAERVQLVKNEAGFFRFIEQ